MDPAKHISEEVRDDMDLIFKNQQQNGPVI